MQVLAHPDPFVLEAELLEEVARAQREDPLAPVLIVLPTLGLARHVSRRIAEHSGARLAVELLDHRTLALRALEAGAGAAPRVASAAIVDELVARAVATLRDGALRRFLAARPGARRALTETLGDLREAGIEPDALARAAPRHGRELADVYAAYVRELTRVATRGMSDEAGLVAAALPHVGRFAERFRAIFHHGAYELIGVHLDLVRALDAARPVSFLLPCEPGGEASRTATAFATGFLATAPDSMRRLDEREGGLVGVRLRALYDERATPAPLPPDTLRVHHAQGARAEAQLAARLALRAVAVDGVPPHEIAIIARTLTPYAAAIEEVLDGEGIPWWGPLAAPLRRQPLIHDLVLLLRVVADDFPRRQAAQLLASPRLNWTKLQPDEAPPAGDVAEAWSREAGILGGLDSWRRDLPAWAKARAPERRQEAVRLADALVALAREVEPGRKRRWSAHAERIERILDTCLVAAREQAQDAPTRGALSRILEDLRDLERALGDTRDIPFPMMVERFEAAVDGATLPARARDEGGIRVLDAMQSRGLTFRRVFLIGMHAGLFPRIPRADPFLDDDTRAELRRASARPIARKADGEAEERILLAMVLGSCAEELAVSWQRSDEAGKAKTPSIALREVARVTLGAPDLERLVLQRARGIPVHPEQALERLRAETDMLSPSDAALLVALRCTDPEQAQARLGARADGLGAGLALLAATERAFAPGDARYDGACAPQPEAGRLSISALQLLGQCPLRYFFRHSLHIHELEDETGPFDVDSREMGERVHAILQRTFDALFREGLLANGRKAQSRPRAAQLVPEMWSAVNADLRERLGAVPVLWRHLCDVWVPSLVAFACAESDRLIADGVASLETEVTRAATLDLGAGVGLEATGRFDRLVQTTSGQIRVSDYKTGHNLEANVSAGDALKGLQLQGPLYRMLAGGDAAVEFLGVGPLHPLEGDAVPAAVFNGFAKPVEEESFRDTLRVLVALERAGRFPIRPDERRCAHCPYRRACRYNHPPTLARHETAPALADFRTLPLKSTRNPRPA